jgi:enoyl-CoA hydratase
MDYENIISEYRDGICYLIINRPKQLNALNGATISELNKAIIKADNDKLVRCIILTGAETKAFVAGAVKIIHLTNLSLSAFIIALLSSEIVAPLSAFNCFGLFIIK